MSTTTARRAAPSVGAPRFTISRERLIEGLAAVMPSVPTKSTLSILNHLLFEATDAGLRITGTDLDMTLSTGIPVDVETAGRITVPAKRLQSIAKELPPAPVRIAATKTHVTIDCGRAHFKLVALPVDEFPELPDVRFNGGTIPASELGELVSRIAFAASTEDSRPILNGVLWQRQGSCFRLVATDGHRLARADRPTEPGLGESGDFILPKKAIEQVARLFGDEDLEVGTGVNHIAFRSESHAVCTRLIEGPYPDYTIVIPKKHTREVVIDRVAFVSAIKRCVPVADSSSHRVVLTFGDGLVKISARTPDIGEATDEVAARIGGDEITLGMNASYLLQVLGAIGTDEVVLRMTEPTKAVSLRPIDDHMKGERLYLLMPMRVLE